LKRHRGQVGAGQPNHLRVVGDSTNADSSLAIAARVTFEGGVEGESGTARYIAIPLSTGLEIGQGQAGDGFVAQLQGGANVRRLGQGLQTAEAPARLPAPATRPRF